MTMTIDSNSVLLVIVASAGKYKVFEYVQKVCVPSTNNLHSCLSALRTCSYRVCRTTYVRYSSRFSLYTMSYVQGHFTWMECKCDLIEKKRTESSSYYFRTIRERFENDSHCHSHWQSYPYLLILAGYMRFRVHLEKEPYLTTFMLIPTEFLPCTLVSNCFLVAIVPYARSSSYFACWFVFIGIYKSYFFELAPYISYCYLTIIEKEPSTNEKCTWFMLSPTLNRHEFQTFYNRPRSGVDSAQWDWGITVIV